MRVKKSALITIGGMVVVTLIVGMAFKIMFPPERLKAMALWQLQQGIDRRISLEGASFSIWGGLGVEINGLVVEDRPEFQTSGKAFLTVDRFMMYVRFWSLLER